MRNIITHYNETYIQYKKIESFIGYLEENKDYYNDNIEILYTGLINRCYSLWETFNKNAVYSYFTQFKSKFFKNDNLVSKLRLHELPGYITEKGTLNESDNTIYYDLKKDFVTYTSKNIDSNQLNILYDRIEIKIVTELDSNALIKNFLSKQATAFNINADDDGLLSKALKTIINERNSTSHYASIETFMNLDFIKQWIKFYLLLAQEISITLCSEVAKNDEFIYSSIGEFKNHLKRNNVLCIDLFEGVHIKKNGLIGLYKNEKLVDIAKAVCFKTEAGEKDVAAAGDKIGIEFHSIFGKNITINKTTTIKHLTN